MLAHKEPAYGDLACRQSLVHSELASARSILLPLYPGMSTREQDRVIAALRLAERVGSGASDREGRRS